MASFTSVGDTATLSVGDKGEDVRVSISGTYSMEIALQREVGSPGSGSWETIKSWSTANATVAYTYTTKSYGESLRLIVLVDTSGTAIVDLADATIKGIPTSTRRDEVGNTIAAYDQEGVAFPDKVNYRYLANKNRAFLFEDFIGTWAIGDAGPADLWSSTAGSGTGNAVATTVAASINGEVTLTSASDDGVHGANCSAFTGINLGYKANQGGLELEARIKIDDVSEAVIFVGFTDTISTTVELPIFMNAAAIDSDAANACGVVYDVDATTDQFYVGGVKANTDTEPVAYEAIVPVDATYFTVRVKVSAAGVVEAWIDDVYLGRAADAITASTAVTPAIIVGNRSANQVIATIDYIWVAQNR